MIKNTGRMPPEAAGKRIRGKLVCGKVFASWAADGRQPPNWKLTGHDYDIVEWELAD